MKGKPMTKTTDKRDAIQGLLCRDDTDQAGIHFFPYPVKIVITNTESKRQESIWVAQHPEGTWTLQQWQATQDIKPPAPGKSMTATLMFNPTDPEMDDQGRFYV